MDGEAEIIKFLIYLWSCCTSQVFQRRVDKTENFERSWAEYTDGFGDPFSSHWLGKMRNCGLEMSSALK